MASISLILSVTSPASTSLTFIPAAPFTGSGSSFTAAGPIASGATVGTVTVAPTGWSGALSLSGAQAASFSLSAMSLVTTAALPAGTYNVTVTATP